MALTREAVAAIFQEHSNSIADGVWGKPGDWADKVLALDVEPDLEPCKSEEWSWAVFRSEQVDPYWMRCTRVGPHDQHEDSNTGATWTD